MNPHQVQDEILRSLRNPSELAAWRASQGTKPTTATPASGVTPRKRRTYRLAANRVALRPSVSWALRTDWITYATPSGSTEYVRQRSRKRRLNPRNHDDFRINGQLIVTRQLMRDNPPTPPVACEVCLLIHSSRLTCRAEQTAWESLPSMRRRKQAKRALAWRKA